MGSTMGSPLSAPLTLVPLVGRFPFWGQEEQVVCFWSVKSIFSPVGLSLWLSSHGWVGGELLLGVASHFLARPRLNQRVWAHLGPT